MTEAILAGLLIAALLGWAVTNTLYARATLPMMNAFRVLHEVDFKFDQRVNAILNRERERREGLKPAIPSGKPVIPAGVPTNPVFEAMGAPLIPNFLQEEQPDSRLESTDA